MTQSASRYAVASILAMLFALIVFAAAAAMPQQARAEEQGAAVSQEQAVASGGEDAAANEVAATVQTQPAETGETPAPEAAPPAASQEKPSTAVGHPIDGDAADEGADTEKADPQNDDEPEADSQATADDEPVEKGTVDATPAAPVKLAASASAAPAADTAAAKATTATAAKTTTQAATTTAATSTAKTGSTAKKTTTQAVAQQVLANGVYYIESAKRSVVLDMSGKSKKAGGNAIVWDYNGGANQQWQITCIDASKNIYTIQNVLSKLFLDVNGASKKPGANVIQWTKKNTGAANQQWVITETAKNSGKYQIASNLNPGQLVLDISGGRANSGDNTIIWGSKKSDNANQQWYFIPKNVDLTKAKSYGAANIEEGVYTLALKANSKLVDVEAISQDNGKNVDMWASNGGMNQKWFVKSLGGNLYSLVAVHSGKALDVNCESIIAGANVLQWTQKGSANQKWYVKKNDNGTYSFVSAQSGMALHGNGSNVFTWFNTSGSSAYQQFTLTPFLTSKVTKQVVPNGLYSIQMRSNMNQAFDVPANSKAEGKQLEVWSYNKGLNQKFDIAYNSAKGAYTLKSRGTGKYVTLSGNKVVQASKANNNSYWKLAWDRNGSGFILIAANGTQVNVASGVKQGNNLYTANAPATAIKDVAFITRPVVELEPVELRALEKAKRYGSRTKYYISVDKAAHRVIVFEKSTGPMSVSGWQVKFNWPMICGKPSTPTPEGNFKLGGGYYTNKDPVSDCFSAYYYRHIHSGTYFHSLLKKPFSGPNGKVIHGNTFGTNVSGGCVRLAVENAKWIYTSVPNNTGLSVYS